MDVLTGVELFQAANKKTRYRNSGSVFGGMIDLSRKAICQTIWPHLGCRFVVFWVPLVTGSVVESACEHFVGTTGGLPTFQFPF